MEEGMLMLEENPCNPELDEPYGFEDEDYLPILYEAKPKRQRKKAKPEPTTQLNWATVLLVGGFGYLAWYYWKYKDWPWNRLSLFGRRAIAAVRRPTLLPARVGRIGQQQRYPYQPASQSVIPLHESANPFEESITLIVP